MLRPEVDSVVTDLPCVDLLIFFGRAQSGRLFGTDGAGEGRVGRNQACPFLADFSISARQRSRKAPRNGSRRNCCSQLGPGGTEAGTLRRVAGQTRNGDGHGC